MVETQPVLEKVVAFITRQTKQGGEVLFFRHPYAGIQIPAGTVEDGETVEVAALREGQEESGLDHLEIERYLGFKDENFPEHLRIVLKETPVFSRPDTSSFDWARLRRGIQVKVERYQAGYMQITYAESDDAEKPQFTSYQITGWVPCEALGCVVRRHFFQLRWRGEGPRDWQIMTDNHVFSPFWAARDNLPQLIANQKYWLEFLK
jgi:ADP-ribose pyrophosphatase YjhB (NUDIX family)